MMPGKEKTRLHRKTAFSPRLTKEEVKALPGRPPAPLNRQMAPRLRLALLDHYTDLYGRGLLSPTVYFRQKAAILGKLQQDYGNGAVQRLVKEVESRRAGAVQTKLTVGPAGDRYEREADRVARAVVAFLASPRNRPASRMMAEASNVRTRQVVERAVSARGGVVERGIENAIRNARGGGRSLPGNLRAELERAFGADFNGVKIHTGAVPDRLNHYLGSAAFTIGKDIFFRKGYYRPDNNRGREILAHELTHVIQQGHGKA